MTLDGYGQLLSGDLAGVADALGKAIESVAVSLGYSNPITLKRRRYTQRISTGAVAQLVRAADS